MSLKYFFSRPSHGEVWRLAWPIILSNSSVPLLGAVDTAVVGHLPDAHYIGAVAIGAMMFSFLYWGFGFLRMGTTGFVAQAAGQKDPDEIRAVMGRALLLSLIISVFVLALQSVVLWSALNLIDSSAAVEKGASDYFSIRVWGAPAVLANYALMGFFIGTKNTRAALMIQIFMNGMNIVLDLFFVLGLGWDVAGVATATLISEVSACLFGGYLVRRHLLKLGGIWYRSSLFAGSKLTQLLRVNFDIFIRSILLIFAFAYFTAQAASKGDTTLAAVAVLMNFMHIMAYGLDGFAFATEGMVGSALGAKKPELLREIVLVSSFWALIVATIYTLIYALFGPSLINLLTSIPEVREQANNFLPWMMVAPLISIWSYQLDGIFIGAVQSKEMRNGMIISFVLYMIGMQVFDNIWGANGLWAALMLFMAARGVTLALVYPRVERRATA
ncbi:MAG: MATE family efflux transporter [Sneathiella sp.]|uniref:MATE family efflux transporter n=1 Tax=Sneathiella sp. TaxID=1964365 RepID=UPI003001030F